MSAVAAARELRSFLRRHGSRTPGAARTVLEGLREVVPADCTAISLWDPTIGTHRTLASTYPAEATALIDGRMHTDRLFAVVRAGGRPVRVRDPADPRDAVQLERLGRRGSGGEGAPQRVPQRARVRRGVCV